MGADPRFGEKSRAALRAAYDRGALLACDVVWAEVRAHFPSDEACETALRLLGLRFEPLSREAALVAGRLWRESRRDTPGARGRVVADFLIGAHALVQAEMLLTRDRGFYQRYFHGLRVVDPTRA